MKLLAGIRSKLTFSNAMAATAVFLVLVTGTAYAANQFTGDDIVDGSLTGADLATNTVTGANIHNSTIRSVDILDGTVTGADILDGTVTGADISNSTVTGADVLDGTLTGADTLNSSLTGSDVAEFSLSNEDVGVLYAVVNSNGSLARGSVGVTSSFIAPGGYLVDFSHNVSGCALSATIGPATPGFPPTGTVTVSPRSGNIEGVSVYTWNSNFGLTSRPFHLIVVC
jgi:hypothetical protein